MTSPDLAQQRAQVHHGSLEALRRRPVVLGLLGLLTPDQAGELLEQMRDDLAIDLMESMGAVAVAPLLEAMSADEAVRRLSALPGLGLWTATATVIASRTVSRADTRSPTRCSE